MDVKDSAQYLRSPKAVREQCAYLTGLGEEGKLTHVQIHKHLLDQAADVVLRHLEASGENLLNPNFSIWRLYGPKRIALLSTKLANLDPEQSAKVRLELSTVSVLLHNITDKKWVYEDKLEGLTTNMREGAARACFDYFMEGGFSGDPEVPMTADLATLRLISKSELESAFQVTAQNRLLNLEHRLNMLHKLAQAISTHKPIFGETDPRLGNMFEFLASHAGNSKIPARKILSCVLEGLGSLWPGRYSSGGMTLGDTWKHHLLPTEEPGQGFVPLHSTAQWLAYSFFEPLTEGGLEITHQEEMTALSDPRSVDLFLDLGVLTLKDDALLSTAMKIDAEALIELRAASVTLAEQLAELIRTKLGRSDLELPLTNVLEAGTGRAAQALAKSKRPDGSPLLRLSGESGVF